MTANKTIGHLLATGHDIRARGPGECWAETFYQAPGARGDRYAALYFGSRPSVILRFLWFLSIRCPSGPSSRFRYNHQRAAAYFDG